DLEVAVPRSMQNERRHPNGWQYPSKVSVHVRGEHGGSRSGTQGQSLVAGVPAPEPFIVSDAGRKDFQPAIRSPDVFDPLEGRGRPIGGEAPRVIDVVKAPGALGGQD